MPANKNTTPVASAPKQMAVDLEAELTAMEEAIVAEAAQKAAASAKVGKRQAKGPTEDEGASKKKKMQEDGEEELDEVAWVACCKCTLILIFLIAFLLTVSVDAITNK